MEWTFDRRIAVTNLAVVVIGSGLAISEFGPSFYSKMVAAEQDSFVPTDTHTQISADRLKTFADGSALYEIDYHIDTRDESKQQVSFSYSALRVFVGKPKDPGLGLRDAIQYNSPPDIVPPQDDDQGTDGPLAWTSATCAAGFSPKLNLNSTAGAKIKQFIEKVCSAHFEKGSLLTGTFGPGMDNGYDTSFLVRARPGDYVGLSFTFGLNESLDADSDLVGIQHDVAKLG
jgi:hypothetical protein